MKRIYKTFRLAYETKYWINQIIEHKEKELQEQTNLLTTIEDSILKEYSLDGISLTITLNVTTGSIIELAVKESENIAISQWEEIAAEVEVEKNKINITGENTSTPKICLSEEAYNKLEALQLKLKTGKRVPLISYVIKLVIYNLYKKTIASIL